MRRYVYLILLLFTAFPRSASATIFGQMQGVVHDPQHRPISGASITIQSQHSSFTATGTTNAEGAFTFPALPLGEYLVTVTRTGFKPVEEQVTVVSNATSVRHFELQIGSVTESVTITAPRNGEAANASSVTPTTLVGKEEIARTPGADRTNSMAMITDYVPGAYMTHDMLHMRGGHQVSWLIDGVEIPNTNIASNVGAQIDPKDIDYVEIQRGSYASDVGDRTYGVFNVVPRTGFERDREAELVLTAGNFLSTNDQLSFGDHTEKLGYYTSLSGNRTDYGLSTPVGQIRHDAANGLGAFGSVIYNRSAKDQFRLVGQVRRDSFQIPYDPDPNSFGNQQYDSSGLRDAQKEVDGLVALSWMRTLGTSTVFEAAPFYHYNSANYEANPLDTPIASTARRASQYGGAQASVTGTLARNGLQAGFYGFGQHDSETFGAIFNDGSGNASFLKTAPETGSVIEEFVSDTFKATEWLTLIAGLRETRFEGQFTETATSPRFGIAIKIPRLGWVFRGFYGHFYQPPPLLTAAGPVVQFAQANNTDFEPLHGERDEEHQFGVSIPWRGWVVDADTFKTRINNFLDHSNIGDSSIYFPVTVDGALVRAWEVALRSPRLWKFGQAHLAYSNQIATQRGAITGGLVCAPVASPQCDAGFTYEPVDHDQRNTLNVGFNAVLPGRISASTNVYYGSGFVNGNPDPSTPYPNGYLPEHTTFDLSVGKSLGEKTSISITALNVANRRVLLDNSLTFGGFHFNDPRQLYGEIRYRFHY